MDIRCDDLKAELGKIIELQKIDSEIYALKREKEITKPAQVGKLREDFEDSKKKLAAYQETVKQCQLKKKDKELDLTTKEEAVRKAQSQLYQLKTNKEYNAKLGEIESLKADVSVLEEDILKVMEELDAAEADLTKAKDLLSQEETTFKTREKEINQEIKSIEEKISVLMIDRGKISENVDKNILSVYEKLLLSRGGVAAALVERENCGACHMKVTAQKINEIKMYKSLIFCENCLRILYLEEDE